VGTVGGAVENLKHIVPSAKIGDDVRNALSLFLVLTTGANCGFGSAVIDTLYSWFTFSGYLNKFRQLIARKNLISTSLLSRR
jgi:hypothetical protein